MEATSRNSAGPVWPALLLFQGVWAGCIAAGAGAAPPFVVFAALAASVLFAVHVLPLQALPIAVALVLTGWVNDLFLARIGLFRFTAGSFETTLWLAAIWFSFVVTAPAVYRWLTCRPALAFGVGAVGGTLSYSMASLWGAIAIPSPFAFYAALPLVWGVRMLCVLWFMTCIEHIVTRTGHPTLQRPRRPHPFPKGATPCER
jgi:hypothetical protein